MAITSTPPSTAATANNVELELDFTSAYKQTALFIKGGKAFFGIWNPLPVQIDGDEEIIEVKQGLQGQLDLFADQVYHDRRLWFVIGQANLINKPFEDVQIGTKLIIPKPANVRAALLATITQSLGRPISGS